MSRPVFLCCLLWAQLILASTQTNLFVSPAGSGAIFSQAQPGNLFAARDVVRTLSTNMTGDVVVTLLGGTYSLTNSLQLREDATNHDSGTGGFNVIYQAASGQTPILSGGMAVTGWSLFDATKNIWRAYVGTNLNSRQLYVNGVRAIRVRGPLNPSGFTTNTAGTGFNTTNTAMQFWANQTNIEIVQRHNWKQLRCPIASISGTNIVMQTPGWTFTGVTPSPGRPWNGNGKVSLTGVSWVENAYELLNGPGMWYLNQATGYLYYIPRPGENLATATVLLPLVEKLIDASGGSLTTPIHNLVFSGITFQYATWLLPSTSSGYADNQTGIMWSGPTNALKTLGNISFQTAANIQITNCIFAHLGGSAIDFGGGAHSNTIAGNRIDDISSCGITLGEVIDYAATDPNQMTDGNTIRDNYIRRPGQEYEDAIGIWVGYSKNTLITHNDIDNTPYSGICLGWGWGTTNYSINNQVVANYVGKIMQTLIDGGSCYSLSEESNSLNSANYYKDSGYQGIYWDEGSAYWTASSNVFDNCAHDYIHFNSSSGTLNNHDNVATNNFSNITSFNSKGTNDVVTNTVYVTGQFWPSAAQALIASAGLEPAYAQLKSPERLVNDTEPAFDHVPTDWTYSSARLLGDYHGDTRFTQLDGQYLQYTFTATAISWLGEMNTDMGNVDVWFDGVFQSTVNCSNSTRVAQQRLFTATNLSPGPHTLKLIKNGGTYLMLDAFAVTPTNFWLTVTPNAVAVNAGNTISNVVKLDVFNGFSGSAALSVSGLPANCSASFSPALVTGAGFSTLTITTSNTTPAGVYELTISGAGGGITNIATMNLTVNAAPIPLPPPWADADIGAPPIPGGATYTNPVFTITGCGSDIYNAADQFNFAYQPAVGDVTNITRVATLLSANVWSKTGVMLRESTAAGSKYVGIYVTISNGVSMQFRSGTSSNAIDLARATGFIAPYWVKLVRSGSTFTGYRSPDGTNWTQVGTTNFSMANSLLAGLAVCSHDTTKSNLSTFDHVSISPADTDGDGIPDWWMLQYFGHATGQSSDHSLAANDADGDGFSNWQEFLAGTNPTNAASYLHILALTRTGNNEQITWASVGGKNYIVEAASSLGGISNFVGVSPPVPGPGAGEASTNYIDAGAATNSAIRFYRVRLSLP